MTENLSTDFIQNLQASVSAFMPESMLALTLLVALTADMVFKRLKNVAGVFGLLGFIATGYFLYIQDVQNSAGIFSNMLAVDSFGQFFKFIILITSFIIILMSFFSKELYENDNTMGEYFSMIIGMTLGMFLLSSATNLIMIYISIEIMSLSSYILAGYTKQIKRASEASLKYVIYGSVSSGIMIWGISILYGLTGSLNLYEINSILNAGTTDIVPLIISILMIVAGFGYKISAVPFHFWTPDVYEGAPVTITAFLSVASKAAGFAVLLRFVKIGFIDGIPDENGLWAVVQGVDWHYILAVLSVLTMTIGNLVALWQDNVKRMLAYSSIAHAGYMLMGLVVLNDIGVTAIMVYFIYYLFMNIGAFMYVMFIANKIGSEDLYDYEGIGYREPVLGACMIIFLVSLTGLPPTAGFVGKLYIFTAVLDAGYIWLAVVGVLNSVISLYYYFKIARSMYLRGTDKPVEELHVNPAGVGLVILMAIPTLLFGLFWAPIAKWAETSISMFLG